MHVTYQLKQHLDRCLVCERASSILCAARWQVWFLQLAPRRAGVCIHKHNAHWSLHLFPQTDQSGCLAPSPHRPMIGYLFPIILIQTACPWDRWGNSATSISIHSSRRQWVCLLPVFSLCRHGVRQSGYSSRKLLFFSPGVVNMSDFFSLSFFFFFFTSFTFHFLLIVLAYP